MPDPSNKPLAIYFRSPIIHKLLVLLSKLLFWSHGQNSSLGSGSVPTGGGHKTSKYCKPVRRIMEGVCISSSAMAFFHWRIRFANSILSSVLALRTVLVAVGRCTHKMRGRLLGLPLAATSRLPNRKEAALWRTLMAIVPPEGLETHRIVAITRNLALVATNYSA